MKGEMGAYGEAHAGGCQAGEDRQVGERSGHRSEFEGGSLLTDVPILGGMCTSDAWQICGRKRDFSSR
jgi:hypothetical protein